MAGRGARGGQQPFKLQGRDDVGETPETELLGELGLVRFVAWREDDGADRDGLGALDLVTTRAGDRYEVRVV